VSIDCRDFDGDSLGRPDLAFFAPRSLAMPIVCAGELTGKKVLSTKDAETSFRLQFQLRFSLVRIAHVPDRKIE
jgi:hypothetical protein